MFDFEESRVVGSMVEKAMTTPDNYPMSLNAVVVACNQVSNRDPVVQFSEAEVERTLRRLADRGIAKMVHRPGDRVVKYRHALDEHLDASPAELALLAVLLLRGEQTPGDLRQRTARYFDFALLGDVEATLDALGAREPPLARRLDRVPGQKEHRYRHLLGIGGEHTAVTVPRRPVEAIRQEAVPGAETPMDEAGSPQPEAPALRSEVAELRTEVAELRTELAELRTELAELRTELGELQPELAELRTEVAFTKEQLGL
jgi:hypothetical protein